MRRVILTVILSLLVPACGPIRLEQLEGKIKPVQKIDCAPPEVLARYTAFYLSQVKILSNDEGRLVPAEGREISDLESTLREDVIRALGNRATVFNQPSRGVGIISISVLDVYSDSALLNLQPGILLPNNFRGGATMKAAITDSISGGTICTIYDSRQGERQGFFSGLRKWDGVKQTFKEWADLIASL